MDFQRLSGDLRSLRQRNATLVLAVALLCASHLIALAVILSLLGAVRTVVVPPQIHKSFWVSASHASPEYLEQMASFIAWLILDVSPASIDWKKDTLLGYVAPDQHGGFRARQELESERLKRINASTSFAPLQLQVDEPAQTVIVRGRLRTFVNGLETSTELRAYQVVFGYAGARLHLQTFKEIPYAPK